jgi:hypothetical protein
MDVWCVCAFFCVCVVLCLGRDLATSWSPVQGVLPYVKDQETEESALCSKMGASPQVGARWSKNKNMIQDHNSHFHSRFLLHSFPPFFRYRIPRILSFRIGLLIIPEAITVKLPNLTVECFNFCFEFGRCRIQISAQRPAVLAEGFPDLWVLQCKYRDSTLN